MKIPSFRRPAAEPAPPSVVPPAGAAPSPAVAVVPDRGTRFRSGEQPVVALTAVLAELGFDLRGESRVERTVDGTGAGSVSWYFNDLEYVRENTIDGHSYELEMLARKYICSGGPLADVLDAAFRADEMVRDSSDLDAAGLAAQTAVVDVLRRTARLVEDALNEQRDVDAADVRANLTAVEPLLADLEAETSRRRALNEKRVADQRRAKEARRAAEQSAAQSGRDTGR